jgi:hypothetical protein
MTTENETEHYMPMEISPIEAGERAIIDMQIATAKRYPRKPLAVKDEIMSAATLDMETAEACFYTLPRAGKDIKGKSVRLAEIALAAYGNIKAGTRIVSTVKDGDNPHVIIQAVCIDLEKNNAVTIEKRRRITAKNAKGGGKRPIDEDDIQLAVNACSAIAFRDSVFKIIPGTMTNPACDAAMKVAIGDAKTLASRRATAVDRICKMGVDKKRVFAAVGKTALEEIDLADLETLFGLYNAIKEGQSTPDEAFPEAAKASAMQAKKEITLDDLDMGDAKGGEDASK